MAPRIQKRGLDILVHAYLHIHRVEECNSSKSMKASLDAERIIEDIVGVEKFFAARSRHRRSCKKCHRRGFKPKSKAQTIKMLDDLVSTVGNLLSRAQQLKQAKQRLIDKYGKTDSNVSEQ